MDKSKYDIPCPTLSELPPPPPGKTGWPWTEESPQLPDSMPDGQPWPKISIVTPSYNQGEFIEETIRSVLLQGYPNLEYIIMDGGSTDNSVDIIKKYESWLAYWVSEPDRGQSHAINKGFKKTSGNIGAWINSDDLYLPSAFYFVAIECIKYPKFSHAVIYGKTQVRNVELNKKLSTFGVNFEAEHLKKGCTIAQASTFFSILLFKKIGGIDENYNLAFDYHLWLRMAKEEAIFNFIPLELAIWRQYDSIKSIRFRKQQIIEAINAVAEVFGEVPVAWVHRYISAWLPWTASKWKVIRGVTYIMRRLMKIIMVKWLQYRNVTVS